MKLFRTIFLTAALCAVCSVSAFASEMTEEPQTVKFTYDSFTEDPVITFDDEGQDYLYHLAVSEFQKGMREITLTDSDMQRIFNCTNVSESRIYYALYRVNQLINKTAFERGYDHMSLFKNDFVTTGSNLFRNPTIRMNENFKLKASDEDILYLKGIYDELEIHEGMRQEAAARRIAGWIVNNYSYEDIYEVNPDVWTVLRTKKGICHNYAGTFRLLCRACGIECYYISGMESGGQLHAWNKTVINGKELYTDCTWHQNDKKWLMRDLDDFPDHIAFDCR